MIEFIAVLGLIAVALICVFSFVAVERLPVTSYQRRHRGTFQAGLVGVGTIALYSLVELYHGFVVASFSWIFVVLMVGYVLMDWRNWKRMLACRAPFSWFLKVTVKDRALYMQDCMKKIESSWQAIIDETNTQNCAVDYGIQESDVDQFRDTAAQQLQETEALHKAMNAAAEVSFYPQIQAFGPGRKD